MSRIFGVLLLSLLVSGCAEVKPWQKEHLAKPHMAFEPDNAEAKLMRHIEESREASTGGYGIGGGGCGCN